MRWMERVRRFAGLLLRRERFERELAEELAQHVELEMADRVRAGMTEAEARRTTLRDFGAVDRWKEEARASRGLGGVDAARQDLRYAVRTLRRSPGFALVAVVTLALGIGATTAVFSVVDGLLLEPLGYASPERVVRLTEPQADGQDRGTISAANFMDWMAGAGVFEAGALYDEYRPTLRLGGDAVKLQAASVGAQYFDVLGVRPQVGRFFLPDEARDARRVVLGDGLWRELFGGDPGVIGAVLDLDGTPHTVVGVAPPLEDPGLSGAHMQAPRLWRSAPDYFYTNNRGSRSFAGVARLRPGVSIEAAAAAVAGVQAGLLEAYPEANEGRAVRVVSLKDDLLGDTAPVLWVLLGSVGLVLLIACANVANLLLFRGAGRSREVALRGALGASRGRVVRQLVVESLVLGAMGGAAGVVVAHVAVRGMLALAAGQLPRVEGVGVDGGVLAFALLAGVGSALLFGLVPALRTARPEAAEALKEGGRGSSGSRSEGRLRTVVVAAEVALAVVVMLAAGLLGRSLLRLQGVDPGMTPDAVLAFRIDPPADPYTPFTAEGNAALHGLYERLRSRLLAVPGVESVGFTDLLHMSGSFNGNPYWLAGEERPSRADVGMAETRAVDHGYLPTLRIPVIAGRELRPTDGPDAPSVVVVSESLAREQFAGGAAVGQRLRVGVYGDDPPALEIVGVVGDVTQFSLDEAPVPTIYMATPQAPDWMQNEPWVVVRSGVDPATLVGSVRRAVAEVDPRIPVYDAAPMAELVDRTLAGARFRTVLLLSFAGLAFVLAAIGVYGMVAFTVARRLPELGVRMALGADAGRIRRLVVGEGLRPVLAGAALGVLGGLAAVRLVAGLLYGVAATDPVTFAATPLLLALVAVVAAWLPARRAARLAPAAVLRQE